MKKGFFTLTLFLLVPTLAYPAWVKQISGTERNLRSVWVFEPYYSNALVAVGDSGTILTSTDFGQTWITETSPTVQTLYGVSQQLFPHLPKSWGSAVGGDTSGVILRTTDDGFSWSVRATPPYAMYTVSFADTMNGMAAGKAGAIWGTTDGGFTWSQISSPLLPVNWYGCWFGTYVAQMAWFCGQGGTIIETTNAGASWNAQASGTTVTLRAVSFTYGFDHSVVVGDSGRILRTTNQGSTWLPVNSGITDGLFDVICNGLYHIAVGAKGTILRGNWDGSIWIPETSGTTQNLHGVNYLYDDYGFHVWVVGDSGTILYKILPGGVELSLPSPLPFHLRLTALPNPFVSYTTISGHSSDRFTLYDISGRKVGTYKGDRIGQGLPAGVYFLRPMIPNSGTIGLVKIR